MITQEENKMIFTDKQKREVTKKARELVKWLYKNGHPHMKIIVETNRFEIVEGIIGVPCEDLIAE